MIPKWVKCENCSNQHSPACVTCAVLNPELPYINFSRKQEEKLKDNSIYE
jgi:hypothetical protein